MQTRIGAALVRQMIDVPPAKDTTVFDTEVQRFAFRMKPPRPGKKPAAWYFVRYTAPDGRERRMKIGDPTTMTVDDARKAAKAKLAIVDGGGDPKGALDQARAAPTIREIAEQYLASIGFAEKTQKTQTCDRARIDCHILPRIGGEKAAAVTAPAARRLQRQIANDTRRNARKRELGGPGAARKVLRLLSAVLRWAKDEEMIADIPFELRELNLGGDGMREVVITSAEEYARLFATMDELTAKGTLRPEVRAFFMLLASTGLRRGEAWTLRWRQVDLNRRQITLTNSKGSKLARQRGRAVSQTEIVGVPAIAAAALVELMPKEPAPEALVFAPTHGVQLSVNRDWIAVRKAAGLPTGLTLHGLRHSVGTVAAIGGMSMAELQTLLRHKQPGTTARYIHMAAMAGGLADKAMGGVLPAADTHSAEVVPMQRGARR
jgi:integrase